MSGERNAVFSRLNGVTLLVLRAGPIILLCFYQEVISVLNVVQA